MQKPTIRPYRRGDDPHAACVIRGAFEEYGFTFEQHGYNADTEDIQAHYIDKGGWFWVMELDGEIIGTAGLLPETKDTCELWRMYLQSQHRGKGFGKMLLHHILDFAKSQGFTSMDIWSDVKLIDAHRLYRKSGADFIGQRICDDPDRSLENGYIMHL